MERVKSLNQFKKQLKWITRKKFVEVDISSGNSMLWRKQYKRFSLDLYWSQFPNRHWSFSIIGDGENADITICELPEFADFSTLDNLILFFDNHNEEVKNEECSCIKFAGGENGVQTDAKFMLITEA